MTQEGDLVSIRGLVDSDFDLPVRAFDGIFDGYEEEPARGYEGTRINLHFSEVDNLVTVSPYHLPTVTLNIGLSNRNKSKWGYFSNSLTPFIAEDEDLKDCKGRRFSMVFADGFDNRPSPDNFKVWMRDADVEKYPDKMVPTSVWLVTGIDGAGAAEPGEDAGLSASELAEKHLIGKTRGEFNKWAFENPTIRRDPAFQRSVTDKSFINTLLQLGRVIEDENGVFQKTEPTPEAPTSES